MPISTETYPRAKVIVRQASQPFLQRAFGGAFGAFMSCSGVLVKMDFLIRDPDKENATAYCVSVIPKVRHITLAEAREMALEAVANAERRWQVLLEQERQEAARWEP